MADAIRTVATLGEILATARARLRAAGCDTPDLDVRVLASAAFDLDAAGLHLRSASRAAAAATECFETFVARREGGEPVYRILGRRPFYDHEFELSPETLEPRPDTEALVDLAAEALRHVSARRPSPSFADVGTGTGAIAISLLALFPTARGVGIDMSRGALTMAVRNALTAGVVARFTPLCGDYLTAIRSSLDVVVSNPPYIPSWMIDSLSREVRNYDPMLALDGGPDGLDAYRAIAAQSAVILAADGDLLFEIGAGQKDDVCGICDAHGFALRATRSDYAGIVRALWFRRDSAME